MNFNDPIGSPHKFPEIGKEPFNLSDEELAEAWEASPPPVTEDEVTERFQAIFSPQFKLIPQVWLSHPSGKSLRIDFVGMDKSRTVADPVGFELKRGRINEDNFSRFTDAVKQAIDYSQCTISDHRATTWRGAPLRLSFVFPCPYHIYENDNNRYRTSYRDLWAQGALKQASGFGVGAIQYVPRRKQWGAFLAGQPAWWQKAGFTDLATKHNRASRVGSAA